MIEKQNADATDAKFLGERVAEIETLIAVVEQTGQTFAASAAALGECTARAAKFNFSASGLHSFSLQVQREMPDPVSSFPTIIVSKPRRC